MWVSIRFYTTGWRIGFGPLFVRWNNQYSYKEFTIGRISSRDYKSIGGMTFKEWRNAKKTRPHKDMTNDA